MDFRSQYTLEHEAFRRLLRQARQSAGLSQTALAEELESSQLLVSRSELGDRKVDVVELWFYCEALGVPFPEFAQKLDAALRALRADPTSPSPSVPDVVSQPKST